MALSIGKLRYILLTILLDLIWKLMSSAVARYSGNTLISYLYSLGLHATITVWPVSANPLVYGSGRLDIYVPTGHNTFPSCSICLTSVWSWQIC